MLFSQCGHWVMIEQEQIFNNACINFLSFLNMNLNTIADIAFELFFALKNQENDSATF